MNKNKYTLKDSQSIAASILSFTLAFISITNFKLTVWWHYIIGIFVLIIVYCAFFILIDLVTCLYKKYIQRANIGSNFKEEIIELDQIIDMMICIKLEYDLTTNNTYKSILIKRLEIIHEKAINKLAFLEEYSENKSIKHKFNLSDFKLYPEYKEFCNEISGFLKNEKS